MLLRDELRARGRGARLETAWVRPCWPLLSAALCTLGVAGSLLTTVDARLGLGVLVVAFAALAGDVSGLAPFARRLTPRRATQCVVSEPPPTRSDVRVRLIVTAALDGGRTGIAYRFAPLEQRLRHALRGHLSSPPAVLCAAIALLAAIAGARALGLDGRGPSVVAVVPTVLLVVGVAAYLDIALAAPSAVADTSAIAVATTLVARLDAAPPGRVAVELVLAGGAADGQLGLRDYVRRRRRRARPSELAVLAIGPCAGGAPAFHRTEGRLLPARMHPGLIAVARQVGLPGIRRGLTGAIAARRAGWPALGVSALAANGPRALVHPSVDGPDRGPAGTIDRTTDDCVELVRALSRQL